MAALFKNKIKHFQENKVGVDYVVGDIHGCFNLVADHLDEIDFNPETDRLFCVGDLIDRGPYSEQVAEFLNLPFVHAIRGNHEDMLLGFFQQNPNATDYEFLEFGQSNGMSWFILQNKQERENILNVLSELPLIIEVESSRGLVGLVHADIPRNISWEEFKNKIENDDHITIETALWGRGRIVNNIQEYIQGLGRLYVGHTVLNNVHKFGNVVALDTGAVFNRHLSVVNISFESKVLTKKINPKDTGRLNLTSISTEPFSKLDK